MITVKLTIFYHNENIFGIIISSYLAPSSSGLGGSKLRPNHKMCTTYILQCKDNTFYVGSTNNFARSLNEHKNGQNIYTKSRLTLNVFYTKNFDTLKLARNFEGFIKRQRNKDFYEKLQKYDKM